MSNFNKRTMVVAVLGAWVLLSLMTYHVAAADDASKKNEKRVYIELTEEFYQALKTESNKRYSTNPSDDYLRQIAISTRFMVKTNLQILERQEQIIKLLEKQQGK